MLDKGIEAKRGVKSKIKISTKKYVLMLNTVINLTCKVNGFSTLGAATEPKATKFNVLI